MTEDEIVDQLLADFKDDFCERLKYVKLCHKGDLDGDDDDLLWHLTRLSVLKKMLVKREIWLSDIAFSNDANEVVYGLGRVIPVVKTVSARWRTPKHAKTVLQLAQRTVRRFKKNCHAYVFSLSTERDTVQHWNGYGGGLHKCSAPNDPYIAIGFDANSLFYPLELSCDEPSIYVINTVSGDQAADHLAQYWAIKACRALEVLDGSRTSISQAAVYGLLEHILVLACSLVKNSGWEAENEYRLIYITKEFGDEFTELPQRPDGQGRYVPLKWDMDRSPIRAVVPHPLSKRALVKKLLKTAPGGKGIAIYQSDLKPRPQLK